MIRKAMNLQEVKEFIKSQTPETAVYLGTDSERMSIDGVWYADYMTVVVVHINGNKGCRVFGEVVRERDYDQKKDKPAIRLMNEVMKTAELYINLEEVLEGRKVEIHLDINKNPKHGSSCVVSQAVGYIKGTCNIVPMIKPNAWAASFAADHYKEIMANQKVA